MEEGVVANVRYWLVEHPTVRTFEWRPGRTWGASPLFLVPTLFAYLSMTSLLYFTKKSTARNPSTSPNTSPPSVLRIISAVHSLLLVLLSLTMALGCALSTLTQAPDIRWIFCFPANHTPPRGPVFFWAYIFYLSKILEFGDTALILLSNSIRRLTFLHVYHHSVVLVMCYVWLETSQSLVPVALVTNAAVHVVMYWYYAVCALGGRPRWKRAVTDLQIGQFVISFGVSVGMLWMHFGSGGGGGCSGFWGWVFNAVFNGSLLVLFNDFHKRSYNESRRRGVKGKKDE
ncbi:hypothetical protein Sjap_021505 [Stephania japonica]|uniref:very-long-chain 3-oxoacyl-CoA synthase n=1 Tax=Stephania japonica TaxID=461633 RepID=A0AAP0EUA5_9MAGN